MIWTGKKVMLTGGSSGIGLELLKQLTDLGAEVVFCGKEADKVEKVIQQTSAKGITVDLSTEDGILTYFNYAIEKLSTVDLLINNAGFVIVAGIEELKRTDFELMYAVNVIAPARLVQLCLPYFKSQTYGDIVNIGATGGSYGFENGAAYASSKAALLNLSQTLVKELRKDNIRVYHVDPSWTTGTFNNNLGGEIPLDENKLTAEDIAEVIISNLSLKRRAFVPQLSVWATNP
ncbi:SDR family oxidoreductase [Flammeovirga kamogawensis]|uniref:SDR family oxidoreductase n=1 Tax=Flammeovirga kamogawensis TaxID=373891 RepID=A0ABX8H099_9BACT|nr:SDR family oxidoreductase [Flammeovirga kamogawensis]MBB6459030.1 3-oxoacyl-[acyl-carrier protein] reductase [Flammeovirga kamogawensis]QWG08600.1 SDR family oxidoreductase [Flammeovirga kamogawensis]TRX66893.1 SDR family oxidoreductase [Flammeovirga kamogawensis]